VLQGGLGPARAAHPLPEERNVHDDV